ncbi:unnamed protein product [Polarella glacialis]|uniref:Peptide chain release factor domain-containing protein n=1 Tax=Polarella glacialis TaxID=89957 RepID=A0A813I1U6_POLGL|nr:unnamed protein product [Polarella glacialis]CAE8743331.1 unnamed protein product [Polarella glacialis]
MEIRRSRPCCLLLAWAFAAAWLGTPDLALLLAPQAANWPRAAGAAWRRSCSLVPCRAGFSGRRLTPEQAELAPEAARLGVDVLILQSLMESRRQQQVLERDLGESVFGSMSLKEQADKARLLSRLTKLGNLHSELAACITELEEAEELAKGGTDELAQFAREEASALDVRRAQLASDLQLAMLPPDPDDEAKSAILEIRAAAGGDEASIWAEDLMNMYTRYCEIEGLKCEVMDCTRKDGGGVTEVMLGISGDEVYSKLKFESGVHRVQRVPVTESKGRIQTSTATVSIMPEAEISAVDIDDVEKDIDFQYCRAGGKGGQNVNKLETACHAVHRPSGIAVFSRTQRTQMMNRNIAVRLIASKLKERQTSALDSDRAQLRKAQVGTGDRSEKIRTYNYKDSRCSDHRLNQIFGLANVLAGNLQEPVRLLRIMEEGEKLKELARQLQTSISE